MEIVSKTILWQIITQCAVTQDIIKKLASCDLCGRKSGLKTVAFLLCLSIYRHQRDKPVIMVLDHQRQLPACSPHSLIRAFVTIHLFDSISKLAAIEILSSS